MDLFSGTVCQIRSFFCKLLLITAFNHSNRKVIDKEVSTAECGVAVKNLCCFVEGCGKLWI